MIDIDEECKKIEGFEFFSNMGGCGPEDTNYIYIESVQKVFVEPSESEFHGCYHGVESVSYTHLTLPTICSV